MHVEQLVSTHTKFAMSVVMAMGQHAFVMTMNSYSQSCCQHSGLNVPDSRGSLCV